MKKLAYLSLVILISFGLYCQYILLYSFFGYDLYQDTGLIQSHYTSTFGKRNHTAFYLNINFDNEGFHSRKLSATDYFNYKDGDIITMDFTCGYTMLTQSMGIFGGILLFLEVVTVLALFFTWLITTLVK
jgi:hypothetical protein